MKELNFETGLEEYRLNDRCVVRFNPADHKFADKLYAAFDTLQKKQKAKDVDIEKMSPREAFDYLNGLDTEMREVIDGVFGTPVCADLFGDMSVYASAGGSPLWFNLTMTLIGELDEQVKREKALQDEKILKYTKKYHR